MYKTDIKFVLNWCTFFYHFGQLFPVPLRNIFVNPTDMPWCCCGLTDAVTGNPKFGMVLFITIVLPMEVSPATPVVGIAFDVEEDEAIPVAINVL